MQYSQLSTPSFARYCDNDIMCTSTYVLLKLTYKNLAARVSDCTSRY